MSERSPRDEIKGISALQYSVLFFCLLYTGISAVFADTAADSIVKKDSSAIPVKYLDRMVVFGTQFAQYTPSQTIIEAKDFVGKYQDLQSVLETVSGVTVHDIGGFGHYAEAAVRGSAANQVQVFLDGIPLNGATGSAVDISKIPLSTLQEITVYKNYPPVEFFNDNAGAVINLSTATPRQAQAASLEAGSFGYRAGTGMIEAKTGPVSHSINVNYGYADNNYPYTNDRGTTHGPTSTNDDTVETMDNNFFSTVSSRYSNIWKVNPENTLTSQISAEVTDEGIFYYPMADSNDGSIKNKGFSLTETYETVRDSAMRFMVRASGKTDDEQFVRFKPFYLITPVREQVKQPSAVLEAVFKEKIWSPLALAAVVSGSYDGFILNNLVFPGGSAQPDFFRLTGKAGIEAEINLPVKNFAARIGGMCRYELDSTNGKLSYGGFVSGGQSSKKAFPGFYSQLRIEPMQGFTLSAGARYTSRSPGFSEKYLGDANYSGNAELRPETRLEYDAGFSLNKRHVAMSGSVYGATTKDKIIFVMNSLHLFVPQNMDKVTGWGAETDFTFAPFEWIALTNAATYMENTIHSSAVTSWIGKDEPFVPRYTDDLRLRFSYKKFYAGHSAHYDSPYFTGPDNIDKISHNEPELNAWVGIIPDSRRCIDISYRLENYLNVRDYDFPERPMPGIRHYCICRYTF
jgi:iron complex outermembrane receptor protein